MMSFLDEESVPDWVALSCHNVFALMLMSRQHRKAVVSL